MTDEDLKRHEEAVCAMGGGCGAWYAVEQLAAEVRRLRAIVANLEHDARVLNEELESAEEWSRRPETQNAAPPRGVVFGYTPVAK
jgi:outer membrane murein-binding lipoprotein Lpp